MLWRAAFLLATAVAAASGHVIRYDGYRVYRLLPADEEQLHLLAGLDQLHEDIQFWKEAKAVNRAVDVMVSPRVEGAFLEMIQIYGMEAAVYVDNVQKLIDNERGFRRQGESFGWDDYYNLTEIHAWLSSLSETYPDIVTLVVGGSSYEGREILGVNISFAPGNPIVVIEGGIHANEWIGPASVTWFVNQMLTTNDTAISNVVRQFNFYVFPNLNPDGYEYTWTTDRNWRRTRTPYSPCYGADPNRNWDFHWAEEGANTTGCTNYFAGPAPFSEVETRTYSQFLASLGDDFQLYLDFHSYGQMLMFPYGLSSLVAPNYDELLEIAGRAAEVLASRYGTQFTYGSIVDTIYPAAGSSIDWLMGVQAKRFPFAWELRDTGEFGHLLPADQIVPTSEETFDSVLSVLNDVLARTQRVVS
ncbi:zinc carboxypeptidase-like [Schistocerca cancellata]|uniref:zinc carboxypeptidase-like n=1 Tax=Schistocerca cancellata TaxID=274614 RepID=UPI002118BBB7|nr:zinc carboxypeptidase-like [Schistocerca cancellata]